MKSGKDNPPANELRAGINEEQILSAIRRSGYPLQTIIADKLRKRFSIQEEWSFQDADSPTLRTLDIRAERRLLEHERSELRVRPTLELLIECKQSDLPFIFFVSGRSMPSKHFPLFAGLFQNEISVRTDDSRSTWSLTICQALGLDSEPFLCGDVLSCSTFSKCVRKGKEIELSGTEAFQSIALPVAKALRYFSKQVEPPKTAHYHDLYLTLALAVLDAPMIAARIGAEPEMLAFTPWVRIIRNEAVDAAHYFERSQFLGIDFVHKEFFDTYLVDYALPFANEFSKRALRHGCRIGYRKGICS